MVMNSVEINAENLAEIFANFEDLAPKNMKQIRNKGMLNLSEEQQKIISDTISTYANNPSEKLLAEVMKLAQTHPKAFEALFSISGSYSSNKANLYSDVAAQFKEKPFTENLDAILALINSDAFCERQLAGKSEEITTLPEKRNNQLLQIFDHALHGQDSLARNNSWNIIRRLGGSFGRHDLLNFDPQISDKYQVTFAEVRDLISEQGVNLKRLEDKFYIADKSNKLLINFTQKYDMLYKYNSTRIMNTKPEEINRDELETYKKVRDVIVKVAKAQTDRYDKSKPGEEKSVSQQFEEFAGKIWGNEHFDMKTRNSYPVSIYTDAYLTAIYEDIKNGNAHKLSENAVIGLLLADKDGYYLRKINEKEPETAQKIVNSYYRYLQRKAQDVAYYVINKQQQAKNGNSSIGMEYSKALSIDEKESYYTETVKYQDERMSTEGASKKAELQQYEELVARNSELQYKAAANKIKSAALKEICAAYQKVIDNTKDKNPQGKEESLSRENVEKMLADFPNNFTPLQMPNEKAPLLFGGKEKERLANLQKSIEEFNRTADRHKINVNNSVEKIDFSDMREHMLESGNFQSVDAKLPELNEQLKAVNDKLYAEPFLNYSKNWEDIKLEQMENEHQQAHLGLERIRARKEKQKEQAAAVRAPAESSLKKVTSSMNKEEKKAIRESNRKIVDPLTLSREERSKTH